MNDILLLVQKCAHTFSFYDLDTKAALNVVLPNFPHEFTVDVNERFARRHLRDRDRVVARP